MSFVTRLSLHLGAVVVLGVVLVFGAGLYYIAQLVRRGPDETPPVPEEDEAYLSHRPMAASGNP